MALLTVLTGIGLVKLRSEPLICNWMAARERVRTWLVGEEDSMAAVIAGDEEARRKINIRIYGPPFGGRFKPEDRGA